MTKTLSMVSRNNYNLNAKWGFCNIFDFQVNYMLYWQFHFENEILVNCLFTQWKWTYIYWILDLEDQMHLIRDLWISGFQKCKGNGFFEVGRVGSNFQSSLQKMDVLDRRLPLPANLVPDVVAKVFEWERACNRHIEQALAIR